MPTDVVMPQMGESIAEGTIVRWIKKEGDQVARDEPLFEISTDKVDAEIPSPAAGIVDEIRVHEGETVPVNSVVAIIRQADEKQSKKVAGNGTATPPTQAPPAPAPPAPDSAAPAPAATTQPVAPPSEGPPAEGIESRIRQRSSPLVRKIAKDRNIDISTIHGTGIAGRVTKRDILDFIAGSDPTTATAAARPAPPAPSLPESSGLPGQTQPMSVMRKRIAEHMVLSRRTSAHVHSVFEVNFHRVAQIREAKKAEYEKAGAKLTYLSFILKAVVEGLKAVPVVNASIDGDNIVYHEDVNIGIAVALDWGLIVPVIKKADGSNLLGLSRAVTDLAARARNKQLKPDEVSGGTFTVTNPGVFGALFGMPIINQPQVAILGVGNVEKRPVVIDDAIAIRPMAYLTLGYDHRLIDGAVADQFMSHVKQTLQNWDPAQA
jgi:pyruvate dehydrogenase E2 component (dihydrolipoyllysine-residue acetyltransferase)